MLRQVLENLLIGHAGLPDPLPADPMPMLSAWLDEARTAARQPNPNAMTLASSTRDGKPSARIVLCRGIDVADASLTFFTNYESRKAGELDSNPRVAVIFHWDHADRQARVEGRAERTTPAESDTYFQSRPLLSRLGSWASDQSRPMERRLTLIERVLEAAERFDIGPADLLDARGSQHVPRPAHWGGYRVRIDAVELWQGHAGRLHDRARWDRAGVGWRSTRLFP
ncbi:MAG: pyridoxamine 5'-phosphate oxidase [Phycisphaerae bacterium]|nr:pyridoxamine 5'-phosphate oxidase [Phycisphaerae bacterium]